MSKFNPKDSLQKVKEKLQSYASKLKGPTPKKRQKSASKEKAKSFVKLKSGISQLKAKLGKRDFRLSQLKAIRVDKKHFNRILDLRVERMPTLDKIFPLARKLKFPLFFLFGLLCADLVMRTGSFFLLGESDTKAKRVKVAILPKKFLKAKSTYDEIISKNVFCPGCPVPDMKTIAINRPKDCSKAKPLRSSANLVGTIVLSNANYSVATLIEGTQTFALKRGEDFKNHGKVFEIRRTRVCFENQDGLLFYLNLPDVEEVVPKMAANTSSNSGKKQVSKGIYQTGDHELEIDKTFIVEQLNNPNILYEAYATEYKVDGEIQGFRIHSINPGSTIEKLGFKPGDIITEVDGKPMDSVGRAQELYNSAATTSDMSISILRDGNRITKSFTVK